MIGNIQIINAPSILGLKPSGVQLLGDVLIKNGLPEMLRTPYAVNLIKDLNHLYSSKRDRKTGCLNTSAIHEFSLLLKDAVSAIFDAGNLPLVLGGDCSIIIGIMAALKKRGECGLVFMDAHADFYLPHQSVTGEVADMDLGIVTGHGPSVLTDIDGIEPYVEEKNVIHIGQRDEEETRKFNSANIHDTEIKGFDLADIRSRGIENITKDAIQYAGSLSAKYYWIHFDTDVLADEINPAVDYRIPGGLQFEEVEYLVQKLLATQKIAGMSVTIFNPLLDIKGNIAKQIITTLARMYSVG